MSVDVSCHWWRQALQRLPGERLELAVLLIDMLLKLGKLQQAVECMRHVRRVGAVVVRQSVIALQIMIGTDQVCSKILTPPL